MSYRKIGDLIRLVDQRNKDLAITTLVGLTINKEFIPSVANTIGTDMSNYKIIRKNQFACSTMQVRRDKKMPVALLKELDIAIISQAYPVFEVIDENIVLPDYLMLWFTRSEFDREACFHAVGGVRGSLEWEDFCTMELPIPSIEKQREIVAQYEAVANKIKVNEAICEKLEATAQALYKQWFVDFEFPNEEEKPYKSSGGAMVFNEELEKEIPEGWEVKRIQDLIDENYIYKNQDGNHGEIHPKSSDFKSQGVPFLMVNNVKNYCADLINCNFISEEQAKKLRIGFARNNDVLITHKATIGKTVMLYTNYENVILTPQITYYRVKDENKIRSSFIICLFKSNEFQNQFSSHSEQSTRSYLSILNQRVLEILIPKSEVIIEFDKKVEILLKEIYLYTEINQKLTQLQSLLLSRLATLEG